MLRACPGKVEVQFIFPLHGVWSRDESCGQRFTEEETEARRGLLRSKAALSLRAALWRPRAESQG